MTHTITPGVYKRSNKKRTSRTYFNGQFKTCKCGSTDVESQDAGDGKVKIVCNNCGHETLPAMYMTTVRGWWNRQNMESKQ